MPTLTPDDTSAQNDAELFALLKSNTGAFNAFRVANPDYRPDFSGADFTRFSFSNANMRLANLSGAKLDHALIDNRSDFYGVNFRGADLSHVFSHGVRMATADCTGACLRNFDVTDANLNGVKFVDADLTELRTLNSKMWDTDFTRAIMKGVLIWNEKGASGFIIDAVFDDADMTDARLAAGDNGRFCVDRARIKPAAASGSLTYDQWMRAKARHPL
ncbi:uncharacterized protein YjbI with pentapeptide repeats [Rhodoblastus acidophilus]|uniref:pentapeptide repeat-containing protein n=1 Tax=Rhodoblastus acidophilus TaxID=1074 RepID=UPI002225A6F4|nr:pentapeptide repeat-containing protein [Rhodoblastus acidophilus]MCW2317440.1 uncharacterized protein YjbI with pentapeptide repeats [Rhodoblastus acidophilus]